MRRKLATQKARPLELARELRSLSGAKAPATLLPAVLARVGLIDAYWTIDSPLGAVYVAHSPRGITRVARAESAGAFEREYRSHFGRDVRPDPARPPASVRTRIEDDARPAAGRIQFDFSGLTEFEQAVLEKALEIPRGQVRPYGWIAREIGHPAAVRATGSALAKNPIPLLIPCHRVVRSDGHIGNYSLGGARAKRAVLKAEGLAPEAIERLAAQGVRFFGSRSTKIYCFPTCFGAKRITDPKLLHFHSQREAVLAGFRPCKACRPAAA